MRSTLLGCFPLRRYTGAMVLASLLAVFAVTAPVSAHGDIVAFWDFSENGGTTLGDVSTNGLDGAIYGSPSWVAGHLGGTYGDYALRFTGSGAQYVQILDNSLLHVGVTNSPFTLALWAQDSGSSWGEAFCFGTGGARNFFWQEDGGATGYLQSQIWAGYTTLSLAGGGWHHIAMSYNGTNIVVYKDGSPVETRGAGTQTAWGDLYIGRASNGIQPWNGKLSDLIILDTAADVTEVGQIMAGTYPGMPPLPEEPSNGVWTNPASGGNWSDTGNWSSGVVASIGNADLSAIDIVSNNTVHLDAPYTIEHLDFGDTDTNSAAGWTVDNNGDVTNLLTVKGHITVNELGTGQDVTLSTVVAGDNGLTKNGPGPLVVTTNICSGNTTVNGGSLTISNVPTNGGFFFGGGTLAYAGDVAPVGTVQASSSTAFKINVTGGAGNLTIARVHGNYNGLIKGGAGTLILANVNQDSGGVQVDEGTIVLDGQSGNALWYSTCNNATVNPLGTLRLGNTQAGLIFYDGGFTMSGGVFDLNGQSPAVNQDHCVPAIVGSGTVVNSATGTVGTVVAKITGTKTFSGNIVDGPNDGKVAVTLAVAAGATPTWVLSGTNTYSGATTINSGTLKADSTTALSSNSFYAVGNNGTLNLASHDNGIGALTGGGNVTLGAGTLTIGGVNSVSGEFAGVLSGSGSIVKAGTNTLTFSGANTYTGDTTIRRGILSISASSLSKTADLCITSGARIDLDFNGTNTIRSLYVDGRMKLQTTWGSSSSGARRYDDSIFSGSGVLLVTVGVPDVGTSVLVK